jgi:hypothetical protein
MMPVVARSAAVFAFSAVLPVLLRFAGRRALHLPSQLARSLPARKKGSKLPATTGDDDLPEETVAIRETFLLRRITFRR